MRHEFDVDDVFAYVQKAREFMNRADSQCLRGSRTVRLKDTGEEWRETFFMDPTNGYFLVRIDTGRFAGSIKTFFKVDGDIEKWMRDWMFQGAAAFLQKEGKAGYTIESMDTLAREKGYFGRPDILAVAKDGTRLEIDFKNLAKGTTTLGSHDVEQLGGKIGALLTRSGGTKATRTAVEDALGNMQYRIRGAEVDYPMLRANIYKEVALWLEAHGAQQFADLATRVKVIFEGRPVPF